MPKNYASTCVPIQTIPFVSSKVADGNRAFRTAVLDGSCAIFWRVVFIQMQTHLAGNRWEGTRAYCTGCSDSHKAGMRIPGPRGAQHSWRKQWWLTGRDSCIPKIGAIKYVPMLKTWRLIVCQSLDTTNAFAISSVFVTPPGQERRRGVQELGGGGGCQGGWSGLTSLSSEVQRGGTCAAQHLLKRLSREWPHCYP